MFVLVEKAIAVGVLFDRKPEEVDGAPSPGSRLGLFVLLCARRRLHVKLAMPLPLPPCPLCSDRLFVLL